jgi:glycosyltransferase involved in cell wall biosynthesis
MRPSVQILMATYNAARFLREQVQSLFEQSEQDWSLVIRDNASRDTTRQVLQELQSAHPDRIRVILGDTNLGARGNFAKLLELADAPYVMFSDSDDYWLPNKIKDSLALMKRLEAASRPGTPILVHTDLQVVGPELQNLCASYWKYQRLPVHDDTSLERLLVQNYVTGCTTMLNRPLVERARPIPEEAIMHDWWVALVASAFGRIGVLTSPTMLYRQHGQNDTGAKRRDWRYYTTAALRTGSGAQRDVLLTSLARTQRQASAFLKEYAAQLDHRQRALVNAFITLRDANPLARRMTLFRYGFFKGSLLSTLGLILRV